MINTIKDKSRPPARLIPSSGNNDNETDQEEERKYKAIEIVSKNNGKVEE